jgi:Flp pilus assembly protein TadD
MRALLLPLCLAPLLLGCATSGQRSAGAPTWQDRLRLAAAAEANNNIEVALSIYRNAAQAEPDNAEVQARYARALADRGASAEAVLVLEQALARRPGERTLLLALGRTQLRANDLGGAAGSFERLLAQAPGDPDALNGLGVIADLSGDHAGAQARYREGLARAPRHEALRNNLALSLALAGATGEAARLLETLRGEGNTDVRVRHNLALVSAMAGDAAAARRLAGPELGPMEEQRFVATAAQIGMTRGSVPPVPAAPPAPVMLPSRNESAPAAPAAASPSASPPPSRAPAPPAAPEAEAPAPAPIGPVVLRARADTWLQVREREGGRVVFDRVLRAGESHVPPAHRDLVMTVGNAAGLEVVLDGESLPPLGREGTVRRDLPLDPEGLRRLAAAPAPVPASVPAPVPAPSSDPPAAAPPSRPGAVVLTARADTWLQVREREGGRVVFDRVLRAGESHVPPAHRNLVMTVGNAAGLEVTVEGEALPPLGGEGVVRRDLPIEAAALRQLAIAAR